MQEIIQALDDHAAHEGVEVEVRYTSSGDWQDVRPLIEPFAEAWTAIGDLCNRLAKDLIEEERPLTYMESINEGKSLLAHEILRMIAAAESKVADR